MHKQGRAVWLHAWHGAVPVGAPRCGSCIRGFVSPPGDAPITSWRSGPCCVQPYGVSLLCPCSLLPLFLLDPSGIQSQAMETAPVVRWLAAPRPEITLGFCVCPVPRSKGSARSGTCPRAAVSWGRGAVPLPRALLTGLAQGGTRRLSSAVPRPCPGRGARAGRSPHLLALQSPGCTFNCCSKLELIGSASKPLPLLAPKSSGPPWSRRTRRARSLPPGNGQERGSAGQTAGAGGCGVATRGEPVSDGSSEARGKDLAEEVRAEPRPAHGGSAQPLWQGSRGAVCQ